MSIADVPRPGTSRAIHFSETMIDICENYVPSALTRAEVDNLPGLYVLDFGVNWCPHCQAAIAPVREVLQASAIAGYQKIEDGAGRPLGRSFRVKLWPTLIFLSQGREVARVVRPTSPTDVDAAIRQATEG